MNNERISHEGNTEFADQESRITRLGKFALGAVVTTGIYAGGSRLLGSPIDLPLAVALGTSTNVGIHYFSRPNQD